MVVVQTVDGKLTGLSVADGKRLWVYERSEPALSLIGTAAPIVVDDFVLSGFASGKIVALNIKDGRALWGSSQSATRADAAKLNAWWTWTRRFADRARHALRRELSGQDRGCGHARQRPFCYGRATPRRSAAWTRDAAISI